MGAALLGEPGNFIVENFSNSRHLVSPGLGLLAEFNRGIFLKALIVSEFGSGSQAYEGSVRAGAVF